MGIQYDFRLYTKVSYFIVLDLGSEYPTNTADFSERRTIFAHFSSLSSDRAKLAHTDPIDSRLVDSGTMADMYILVNESISYYRRSSQSERGGGVTRIDRCDRSGGGVGVIVMDGAEEQQE